MFAGRIILPAPANDATNSERKQEETERVKDLRRLV
jgi:hypothetical protein